jgi:hypothetical protein
MGTTNRFAQDQKQERSTRAPMVFRFRREPSEKQSNPSSPFTEIPDELKRSRFSFKKLIQGFFSGLFLLILALALIGLIAAFAYQIAYHPDVLAAWSNNLIQTGQSFIQTVVPAK